MILAFTKVASEEVEKFITGSLMVEHIEELLKSYSYALKDVISVYIK